MSKCDIKQVKIHVDVMKNSEAGAKKLFRKMTSKRSIIFLLGMLIGWTLFNLCVLLLQHISIRVATGTYRWYRTPQACLKPTHEVDGMVDLAARSSRALEKLNIPAPVCYGTLWGVLRYKDILSWDNNVDFCVMNEYLHNVSLYDMQNAFADEGVILHDFTYRRGSYHLRRGSTEGHINVFANCTSIVPIIYPDLSMPAFQKDEKIHWACALSVSSLIGRYTYDFNRPFPTWLLTPPFAKARLANIYVNVPHDNYELQKYLYPDDWWLEAKPLGCL